MAPAGTKRRRRWVIAGVLVVVVALGAVLGVGIAIGRSASASSLTLIPSSQPGPNPFAPVPGGATASATTASATAASPKVAQKSAQLRTSLPLSKDTRTPVAGGTTPGLYGGSSDVHVCDSARLVAYLQANRAKASAWARVLGIAVSTIAAYVDGLTPVVLNSDTLVENHGYVSGAATSFPAVLQAGTAVLVDASGVPRVKCNCGNPLSQPSVLCVPSAQLSGTRWGGYAGASVVLVRPGSPSGALTLVDVSSGETYRQPVGSGASTWLAATWSSSADIGIVDQTELWTSSNGVSWTHVAVLPRELVSGLAWGDGRWVAVAQPDDTTTIHSDILSSTDLTTWSVIDTVDGRLRGVAFGGGRWAAAGEPVSSEDYSNGLPAPSNVGVVYTSTTGTTWTQAPPVPTPGVDGFWSIAYGDGRWLAVSGLARSTPVALFASADAGMWSASSVHFADQTGGALAFGAGAWLLADATALPPDPLTFNPAANNILLDASANGAVWTTSSPAILSQRLARGLAYGAGHWLIATEESTLPNPAHSLAVSQIAMSADGAAWSVTGHIDGPLGAVAFGGTPVQPVAPANPAPTSPAPTSPAPTSEAAPSASACGAAALQSALTAAGEQGTIGSEYACSGAWATAGVNHPESQTTAVFQWVQGAWQVKSRATVCAQNVLPSTLVNLACASN